MFLSWKKIELEETGFDSRKKANVQYWDGDDLNLLLYTMLAS